MKIVAPEVVAWPNTRPPESHPDAHISVEQEANGSVMVRITKATLGSSQEGWPTIARITLGTEATLRLIAELAGTLDTSLVADAALKAVMTK